jgi:rhamnosyltransferase
MVGSTENKVNGLAGVVILYHPVMEVFHNIKTYAGCLEKLWIIDNSEYDLQNYLEHFNGYSNIEIIQDGCNKGIGARINTALKQAEQMGCKWLLTMDQDSSFSVSNLDAYKKMIGEINVQEKIAVIGVRFNHEEKQPDEIIVLRDDINLITSGSCINLRVVKEIGYMNEELFIDEVDSEFSYRAVAAGWQVMVCDGIYMKHDLGERKFVRSLATGKVSNRGIHSPVRLYYMTRNYLWVKKKYQAFFPELFRTRSKQFLHVFKNNLLYNRKKIQVLRMIVKGYFDFKKNKLGKLTN